VPPLAALLALLLGAPAPPPPLSACRAIPLGDAGWQYDCDGLTARVEDRTDRKTGPFLDGLQRSHAALLGDGAVRSTKARRVGAEAVEARRTVARDGLATGWAAALVRSQGSRVVACVERGAGDRCGAVLDALAAAAWRSGPATGAVRQEAKPLALGARAVRLPAGCEGTAEPDGGGRVGCPPAFFANWSRVADEAVGRRAMEEYGAAVSSRMSQPPFRSSRDRVRCSLGGVGTDCGRLRVETQGRHVLLLWAVARVDGQLLFGSCMADGDSGPPPPCSLIFGGM